MNVEDCCPTIGTMADVANEMRRALAKHGEHYMGNLTTDVPGSFGGREVLEDMVVLGREAKYAIEKFGDHARILVLLEEVGELAECLLGGVPHPHREELVQVAAMAIAWLDPSPGVPGEVERPARHCPPDCVVGVVGACGPNDCIYQEEVPAT